MDLITTKNHLLTKSKNVEKLLTINNASIMNIQLKTGESVPEHDSKREVIIVVRKGMVSFNVEGEEVELGENHVLHLNPLEKHSLKAIEDTDILVFQIEE